MKNWIKQCLPSPQQLHSFHSLTLLGKLLHNAYLWHINRRSVANAFGIGLFIMWLPVPLQTILVALVSIPCRANLPLSILLVWGSNPITVLPMFYSAYTLGIWVLQRETIPFEFDGSIGGLLNDLGQTGQPLLLGCLLLGLLSAALGYVAVQVTWRMCIYRAIKQRSEKRVIR